MDDDYQTGFGKPPKRTQFKPGRSGNPKGRPKGRKNLASIVDAACQQKVRVKDGRGHRTVSKIDLLVMQLMNKAASGDVKAIKEMVRLYEATGAASLSGMRPPALIVNFIKAKDGKPDPDQS
jgi:Family of unknown function (DUF5681)